MLRVSVRWQLAAPAILVVFAVTLSLVCYRALEARDHAASESIAAKQIAVTISRIDSHGASFAEPVGSATEFQDAAVFQGGVYLSARAGLTAYDSAGKQVATYRVGREVPAGELVALTTGRPQGSTELFIATRGAGILCFNGTRFQQILPTAAHNRSFTSALGLESGKILFGTPGNGVVAWDGKTLGQFLPAIGKSHITAIAGSDADLWIGTIADGAYRLHAGQLDHFADELPDTHVLSIALRGTSAYVGTPIGVVEFKEGRKVRNLADGYFARSLEADNDSLAVGTEDEGIITVPLRTGLRTGNSITSEFRAPVERIFRLDQVRYALAGGLYRCDAPRPTWTPVLAPAKGALADSNIASLAVGRDGRVWIGYFDRGLDVADSRFENVRHFEDDRLFCVNRIVEETGGARTAVATANGLVLFDSALTARQVLTRKDGLLADHVTDVLFRRNGMVIATPAGLSISGPDGVRSLYVFHGLVNNHVYSLAAAGDQLAAGTLGGLSLLDRDVISANYTTANSGLKHNWISALVRLGDDWFAGTYGAAVMRLDASGRWHGFPDLKVGFEVNPNAMFAVGDSLYVGSLDRGLWIYSTRTDRWTNAIVGLPSLNVTAIAAGGGFIYVGTDNGLVRFREGDLP